MWIVLVSTAVGAARSRKCNKFTATAVYSNTATTATDAMAAIGCERTRRRSVQ